MDKTATLSKYYRQAVRLSWETYQVRGVRGLLQGMKRVFKRIILGQTVYYPQARDYTRGLVTVVILTQNRLDLMPSCLEAVNCHGRSKYSVEILVGDTGSDEAEVRQFSRTAVRQQRNLKVVGLGGHNFSKNYNRLIRDEAQGQYLVLLQPDLLVTADWLDNLIDPLADTRIGLVGAKLLGPDNTIHHAGIEFDAAGKAYYPYARQPRDFPAANYAAMVPAVILAAIALRHDVFDRFKLTEYFKGEAQDIDFGLRLGEAGFKVLYNPAVEVYRREPPRRDYSAGNRDQLWVQRKWAARIRGLLAQERQRLPFEAQVYRNAITIIRDDGIGDLLMGVCAFKKLRERHPEKRLVLATYQRNIPMMAGFQIFDEFIPIPDGRKLSPLPIPQDSEVVNFINLEMEFGVVWGITNEDNKVNRHLVYTQRLGLDQDFTLTPLPVYPAARRRVRHLLQEMGCEATRRLVVVSLIASNPARSWWEPYYPRLLEALGEMGFTPLVVGTANRRSFNGKGIINLVGKTRDIPEYIEAIKLGRYVISTDSSAYHIAALAGIPFLAIFTGGMKPEARVNFYEKYEVAEPPAWLTCYPCWDEGCKDLSVRWLKDPCRLIITPEEVIAKFKRLVERFPADASTSGADG